MYVVFPTKEHQTYGGSFRHFPRARCLRGLTRGRRSQAILPCLSARQAGFRRGQFLLRAGDEVRFAGVRAGGRGQSCLQEDFWGNRNLLAAAGPGEICSPRPSPACRRCVAGERAVQNGRARFVSRYPRGLFPLRKGLRAAPDAVTEPYPRAGGEKHAAERKGGLSLTTHDARKAAGLSCGPPGAPGGPQDKPAAFRASCVVRESPPFRSAACFSPPALE